MLRLSFLSWSRAFLLIFVNPGMQGALINPQLLSRFRYGLITFKVNVWATPISPLSIQILSFQIKR